MITRFEDLIAWQKARQLRKSISIVSRREAFARDFDMRDQIRSAALSVMANIAEGFERNKVAQFLYHLKIARGSCNEVRSHLYAAFDDGYLSAATLQSLLEQAAEVSRIIRGLEEKLGTRH
jgi:four helix bundle protein